MKYIAYTLFIPLLLCLVSCQKKPTASFTVDVAGYQVTCHNSSINADSYSWDFGDKSYLSSEKNPVHTYSKGGDYTITLQATSSGGSDQASKYIHISQTGGGGTAGTYTTFICNAIKVVNMPLYDGNERWDVASDADLFFEIYENGTKIYTPKATEYTQNVSSLPITYNLNKKVNFKKNQKYVIRLYDHDDASNHDFIGGIEFNGNLVVQQGNRTSAAINLPDGSIQLVLLGQLD